jgi:hypothetical protein
VVTQDGSEVTTWTVSLPGRPAREALDEVARLSLAAIRLGYAVELRGEGARCISALLGLGVEVLGQPELAEEAGVEEVVMPDDPVA